VRKTYKWVNSVNHLIMISVSLISAYEFCPRKLFLEQVLKLTAIPREAIVKGSVRHEVCEKANKAEEAFVKGIKKELPFNDILEQYKKLHSNILSQSIVRNKSKFTELKIPLTDFFKEAWPLMLQESQQKASNLHNFMRQNKALGEELWRQLSPKVQSEYYVESDELMMKGKVDWLEIYENKFVREVVPYELKTGSAPKVGVWPGHKLQTGAYVMLLEKNRMFVREAFVKYLDINEARPVVMNPFIEKNVLETRDSIIQLFKSNEIPGFCDSDSKCASCALKEQCTNEKFIKEKLSLLS